MKTCKKILAMVLALAVVMSFASVTVNADALDDVEDNKNLWCVWDGDYMADSDNPRNFPANTTAGKKNRMFTNATRDLTYEKLGLGENETLPKWAQAGISSSSANVGSVISKVTLDAEPTADSNYVFKVESSNFQSSYRGWFYNPDSENNDPNNVIRVSLKMMIPEGATTTQRLIVVPFVTSPRGAAPEVYYPVTVTGDDPATEDVVEESYETFVQYDNVFPTDITYAQSDMHKNGTLNQFGGKTYKNYFKAEYDGTETVTITPVLATGFVTKLDTDLKSASVKHGEWFEVDFEYIVPKKDGYVESNMYVNGNLVGSAVCTDMFVYEKTEKVTKKTVLASEPTSTAVKWTYRGVLSIPEAEQKEYTVKYGYGLSDMYISVSDKNLTYVDEWEIYTYNKITPNVVSAPLTITGDATSGLTISGQINNSTYTEADLVVAFYNGNKLITSSITRTPVNKTGSDLVVSGNATVPAGATNVKAFVFDSLTTSKPLMENATLNLGE